MMRARWTMADQAFLDDDALECLFKAITKRYPSVCWVSAREDPDTFEGRSELYWRGRVKGHAVPYKEFKRIAHTLYRQAGTPVDDDEDMNDPAIDSLVDDALLDAAESFWDEYIEQILSRVYKTTEWTKGHVDCSKLDMTS